MFAFALWDREEQKLFLARDRYGQKPLYYAILRGGIVFGSNCRRSAHTRISFRRSAAMHSPCFCASAMCPHPPPSSRTPTSFCRERSSAWMPAPWRTGTQLAPQSYWSAEQVAREGLAAPFEGDPEDAVDELERRLGAAVERCMVSDVSLGAFLSGGLDSSTVVALMQARSTTPVRTFSIGFHEAQYNEANYAAAVAEHLGPHTRNSASPRGRSGCDSGSATAL